MIDWESNSTEILLNPRYPTNEFRLFLEGISGFPGHVWLATSGTSGKSKFVALSKQALLTSAAAVNKHINSNSNDVWLNTLPSFHVGGLGIHARAHLSGAKVIVQQWDPQNIPNCTLCSLVPAQLYDLVKFGKAPPPSLRSIFIGGGALEPTLADQACKLGWPILTTYGLTECSSQVATSRGLLSHVKVKISEGIIHIQSDSLLSAYATLEDGVYDPKQDGWFKTEDRGELNGDILKVFGRSSDFIKIGGESVDLVQLRSILYHLKENLNIKQNLALVSHPDSRLGKVIHLLTDGPIGPLLDRFNSQVLPFARIREVKLVTEIPSKLKI